MHASNFKVIVVGGGPVGLTAAHALTQANIDCIVLESRPSAIIDAGANLVMMPMGIQALSQLGLLDALKRVSTPLGQTERQDHQGRDIGDARWFLYFKKHFGTSPRVLSRHDLTRVLYESLPSKTQNNIITGKRVEDVIPHEDGVEVTCTDGSSYMGSVVIGADGAHSLVRERMRTLALEANATEMNDEKPFLTNYRGFWLRIPTSHTGLQAGITSETHGPDATTQLFSGPDTTVMGLYERLESPTRNRARYTEEDQLALVERWGHLPLAPGGKLTLKEAFSRRTQSGLVNLEEGVVKHWSWDGRIVLAGDAAHKFTPSTGAGCNNGIVDVIVLVNELHRIVQETRNDGYPASPNRSELAKAFNKYQSLRLEAVTAACSGSGQVTASATWQTAVHKFIDKHVLARHSMQSFFFSQGAKKMAQVPRMDFIKDAGCLKGN
ncbi:FAD-binding-3 domain-containing protein [Fusarium falciforme]|uniref:FAD-binding-3 domain-containing protein n=1 Tax=Fusarium falciforme TaxID=195108 RepID=UPI0023015E9C|nr:FAD-binding-3 domain-containing protein [Fusarium falciforme]WAO96879.1 FAD-binding-3 domain-containing protein [Fusarium falciforme]